MNNNNNKNNSINLLIELGNIIYNINNIYNNNNSNIKLNEYFNKFIIEFKNYLNLYNYKIIKFNINYFYINGIIFKKNKYYYFSINRLDKFLFEKNNIYIKLIKYDKNYNYFIY